MIYDLRINVKTIIKGDEKIPAIALASIVAKVKRDKLMRRLHKKYPRYDFINNVGYGTRRHIRAIKKFGLSPIHRRSFTASP
jgi:ribonuclease HII